MPPTAGWGDHITSAQMKWLDPFAIGDDGALLGHGRPSQRIRDFPGAVPLLEAIFADVADAVGAPLHFDEVEIWTPRQLQRHFHQPKDSTRQFWGFVSQLPGREPIMVLNDQVLASMSRLAAGELPANSDERLSFLFQLRVALIVAVHEALHSVGPSDPVQWAQATAQYPLTAPITEGLTELATSRILSSALRHLPIRCELPATLPIDVVQRLGADSPVSILPTPGKTNRVPLPYPVEAAVAEGFVTAFDQMLKRGASSPSRGFDGTLRELLLDRATLSALQHVARDVLGPGHDGEEEVEHLAENIRTAWMTSIDAEQPAFDGLLSGVRDPVRIHAALDAISARAAATARRVIASEMAPLAV